MSQLFWVGVGGFIGANARYLLATWIISLGLKFPLATLAINVSGSLILGAFLTWFSARAQLPDSLRLLVATGFCGAYTTFSTYAYESMMLLRGGDLITAIANIVLTNALCLFASLIGIIMFYGKV